jgi:hypothetical protein
MSIDFQMLRKYHQRVPEFRNKQIVIDDQARWSRFSSHQPGTCLELMSSQSVVSSTRSRRPSEEQIFLKKRLSCS